MTSSLTTGVRARRSFNIFHVAPRAHTKCPESSARPQKEVPVTSAVVTEEEASESAAYAFFAAASARSSPASALHVRPVEIRAAEALSATITYAAPKSIRLFLGNSDEDPMARSPQAAMDDYERTTAAVDVLRLRRAPCRATPEKYRDAFRRRRRTPLIFDDLDAADPPLASISRSIATARRGDDQPRGGDVCPRSRTRRRRHRPRARERRVAEGSRASVRSVVV